MMRSIARKLAAGAGAAVLVSGLALIAAETAHAAVP